MIEVAQLFTFRSHMSSGNRSLGFGLAVDVGRQTGKSNVHLPLFALIRSGDRVDSCSHRFGLRHSNVAPARGFEIPTPQPSQRTPASFLQSLP